MATYASRQLTFEQALSRAASLCGTSEHCIAEIAEKLARWGMSQKQSDEIINRLLDEKYIDESRYAMAYARDKLRFSHWGRVKIRMMLRMQHIPEPLIREALDALDTQEYDDIARQVIEAKMRSTDFTDSYAASNKVIRFAMQRGFETEEIKKYLNSQAMEQE